MSPHAPFARRRALAILAWGLALAVSPVRFGGDGLHPLAPAAAWARDGEDNSGRGGGGDDDDDDRSGPGGGDDDDGDRSGSGDDDDDDRSGPGGGDDDDDDRSGPGGGGDDRDDRVGRNGDGDGRSGPGGGRDGSDGGALRDITVFYPDGWVERIVSGRYELIDHLSRLVVTRPATSEDFARMIALD